jgi:hypothetical protein
MNISITCPTCGGNQFFNAGELNAETPDETELVCVCGVRTSKGALIDNAVKANNGPIVEESLRLAREVARNVFGDRLK